MITGILLWDLSAAFDCLDSSNLCNKILIPSLERESIIVSKSRLRRSRVVKPGYDVLIEKLKKFMYEKVSK